jgi:hypothetical protein
MKTEPKPFFVIKDLINKISKDGVLLVRDKNNNTLVETTKNNNKNG